MKIEDVRKMMVGQCECGLCERAAYIACQLIENETETDAINITGRIMGMVVGNLADPSKVDTVTLKLSGNAHRLARLTAEGKAEIEKQMQDG